jgi:flagellar biosynthesis chaperone FliJ
MPTKKKESNMKPHALGAILAALILSALPVAGQSATTDDAPGKLAEDVKGIRQALDRLVALVEITQRGQQVDLVLKRIELRERRMEPLERRLRSAEREIEEFEEQLKMLERMQEQHEDVLHEEIRDGVDTARSDTRRMLDDIKRSQVGAAERLESVRMRMQQHENDLAAGRREIEILDEMLMELLEDERR